MHRLCLIALVFAFALPTTGAARSELQQPGRALLTYVGSNGGICLIRADGTHAVRVTPRWKQIWSPAWSPKGRYVAFERFTGYDRNHDPVTKITVADAKGHVHWAFGSGLNNSLPLWAPDGRHIEFFELWAHAGALSAARPTGREDRGIAGCIVDGFGVEFCPGSPTWSADGQRLAFVNRVDLDSPDSIFSTRYDGADRRLLVADADWPAYSPAGPRLAYTGPNGSQFLWSLFVADADGSNPHAVTAPSPDAISWPTWSPDGQLLVFERTPCAASTCARAGDLVVIRADGTGPAVVVAREVPSPLSPRTAPPAWSPSGKLIAFTDGKALLVAAADGSGERTVVPHVGVTGGASAPTWRPPVALPPAKRTACPRR